MLKSIMSGRYAPFTACLLSTVAAPFIIGGSTGAAVALSAALLSAVGVHDLIQRKHAITRNYPVIGHLRFLIESFRPELRQYLFETDSEKLPFSRTQRSLVYARAKNEPDQKPFGTIADTYAAGYEFIGHSIATSPVADPSTFKIKIGNEQCLKPYDGSVLNISAMSFGALSANAIMSLNKGAKLGGFAQDTGEGSISPYHREHGGDLVWQIASGYFGCRKEDGSFDETKFINLASDEQIKMIEVKLSQGAKPGHGGVLPAHKVSPEIAETRGIPVGQECISPSSHSTFSDPVGLMELIARLRLLSGGKPVGFKLAIGQPWEFAAIVKAMLETNIFPDFVVIDGSEGGTGAAPVEFSDHVGMPLREALLFAHNTLVGAGIRDKLKIGASGKIISAFDMAYMFAIGADWCNSARGFMFSIGCIQAQSCHTNRCPTGIATQDTTLQRAVAVPEKAERVASFHRNTLHALAELLASSGLTHPSDIRPHHIFRRSSASEVKLLSKHLTFLKSGELLTPRSIEDVYSMAWGLSTPYSFAAATS